MRSIIIGLIGVLPFIASPVLAADAATQEANKKAVLEFYDAALNRKDFDAAAKFFGPHYIQHNPTAPDGIEGFKAFLGFLREKFPDFAERDQARIRRWRQRDPARSQRAREGGARPGHRRHFQAGERQDRRALGRRAGDSGEGRQHQRHVLGPIRTRRAALAQSGCRFSLATNAERLGAEIAASASSFPAAECICGCGARRSRSFASPWTSLICPAGQDPSSTSARWPSRRSAMSCSREKVCAKAAVATSHRTRPAGRASASG